MHKVVTKSGFEFNAGSFVRVGDVEYDMDEMTPEQREQIGAHLGLRFLNSVYAGKVEFSAPDLPSLGEILTDITKEKETP